MEPAADGDDRAQGDLDRARLDVLAERLQQSPATVAGTLHDELVVALEQIDQGLRAGDLTAVGDGAHAARNSALMIGSEPLLTGLRALETAAGRGEAERARRARAQIAERGQRLVAALGAVR